MRVMLPVMEIHQCASPPPLSDPIAPEDRDSSAGQTGNPLTVKFDTAQPRTRYYRSSPRRTFPLRARSAGCGSTHDPHPCVADHAPTAGRFWPD